MNPKENLVTFTVRRSKTERISAIVMLLLFTFGFVWGMFRLAGDIAEGSPYPDLSAYQTANNEFWAGVVFGFIFFAALLLVGLLIFIGAVRWRIIVDGDAVTIQKPFGKKIQLSIFDISGVDARRDSDILMLGTKALTKVKRGDENLTALMKRLGVL